MLAYAAATTPRAAESVGTRVTHSPGRLSTPVESVSLQSPSAGAMSTDCTRLGHAAPVGPATATVSGVVLSLSSLSSPPSSVYVGVCAAVHRVRMPMFRHVPSRYSRARSCLSLSMYNVAKKFLCHVCVCVCV